MIKYLKLRTSSGVAVYNLYELKDMTIETVTLQNQILTEDQYTLVGTVFTITETDIKIEDNQLLKIGYQWVKRT